MRADRLRILALAAATATLAACSAGGASPSPTPDGIPDDAAVRLRVTSVQALPPPATFSWMPQVLVTLDGKVLSGGAVPAIFPGPLVMPVMERQLTQRGWERIVATAREAGLLGLEADFTGGQVAPGSPITRLEILADGRLHELRGDASRVMQCIAPPCNPPPGTPEAFAGFVARLSDLTSWLGPDAGPDQLHTPAGYAVLVTDAPDDQGLPQPPIAWPLEGGFAAFGRPVVNGAGQRCGTVTGEDVAKVRAAFQAATSITKWRDAEDGTFHGLVVRPLLPGDGDPCEGLV